MQTQNLDSSPENPTGAMSATDFPGRDELVDRLDRAVALGDQEAITQAVQETLVDLICREALDLAPQMVRATPGHYARHLVYRSDRLGYTVVAMVWGPEQGTALHDHSGTWCVEGVVSGEIDVTQYELLEHEGKRWRFRRCDTIHSNVGSAGSLIPPYEYHTIANAREDGGSSVTLHVYGRELEQCCIFENAESDWYIQRSRSLSYDN